MTVRAANTNATASALAAFVSAALSLTAPRLPPFVVEQPFSRELHDPEPLVPITVRRVGGVVAGAAPPHGFVPQSPKEELPQAGVAGHAAHHFTDHCRTAARQSRLELLLHEGPSGALAVRPSRTSHAAAMPAAPVATAHFLQPRGAKRAVVAVAAPVHRPPAISRGAAHHRRIGDAPIALRLRGRPCSGRLGGCAALSGRPGSPVPVPPRAPRARVRSKRRRTEPAVLPVDVLRERDARHPGDEGWGISRLGARDGELFDLLCSPEPSPRGG